jgi:AraC-like DNA-binding protein
MERDFTILEIKSVLFVGPEKYKEKKTKFRTELHTHELIYHFNGDATVYFGSQVLHTSQDTIRFLPQGKTSRYEVERKENGSCIDVFFCTDRPISAEAFVASGSGKLGLLFKKMFALWVSKESGYRHGCMALLYEIFSLMEKQSAKDKSGRLLLEPTVSYLGEHFLEPIPDMNTLAALSGISYSYMKKLFVRVYGVSPKQYAIQLKMNYACDLLSTGGYTVSETAELCGFRDVYFFSRQFKNVMGCPPSRFGK